MISPDTEYFSCPKTTVEIVIDTKTIKVIETNLMICFFIILSLSITRLKWTELRNNGKARTGRESAQIRLSYGASASAQSIFRWNIKYIHYLEGEVKKCEFLRCRHMEIIVKKPPFRKLVISKNIKIFTKFVICGCNYSSDKITSFLAGVRSSKS